MHIGSVPYLCANILHDPVWLMASRFKLPFALSGHPSQEPRQWINMHSISNISFPSFFLFVVTRICCIGPSQRTKTARRELAN